MMSNVNQNEFEYVKALVRGLHVPKNVMRPDLNRSHSSPNTRAALRVVDPQSVLLDKLKSVSMSDDDDDDDERDESDKFEKPLETETDKNLMIRPRFVGTALERCRITATGRRHSNFSLSIPSVVVTGATENTDLLSSTQRRFSQLYSGLRRFSTSHTVRISNKSNLLMLLLLFFFCR